MGVFDSLCLESGLVIDSEQALLPIIQTSEGSWAPLALPIAGTNDRYGRMDEPRALDANMKAFTAFGKKLSFETKGVKITLPNVIDQIQGSTSGATYDGKPVSFALFDLAIYRAIVKAVSKGTGTAWRRFAQRALHQAEPPLPFRAKPKKKPTAPRIHAVTKQLAQQILAAPDDEAPRKVLVDHLLERGDPLGKSLSVLPVLGKLSLDKLAAIGLPVTTAVYGSTLDAHKTALRDLVRFLAWGTVLAPTEGGSQIFGYESSDPNDDAASKRYTDRARLKYAGMPELLAICDRNEKAFRARGADTGFDAPDED